MGGGAPPGVLYRCANNGVAGRGICKLMKTARIKIDRRLGCFGVAQDKELAPGKSAKDKWTQSRPWLSMYHTDTVLSRKFAVSKWEFWVINVFRRNAITFGLSSFSLCRTSVPLLAPIRAAR